MDAQQIEKLKQIVEAASPGPWAWWTSNSTYRLTGADGKDGGVLYASQHRGYADVACSEPNRAFIEAFNPAVAGALLAEVERLRAELAAGAARQGGDTIDVRYEFERWASQRGDAAVYIGDGLCQSGFITDQAEAFAAGVELGRLAATTASDKAKYKEKA